MRTFSLVMVVQVSGVKRLPKRGRRKQRTASMWRRSKKKETFRKISFAKYKNFEKSTLHFKNF